MYLYILYIYIYIWYIFSKTIMQKSRVFLKNAEVILNFFRDKLGRILEFYQTFTYDKKYLTKKPIK